MNSVASILLKTSPKFIFFSPQISHQIHLFPPNFSPDPPFSPKFLTRSTFFPQISHQIHLFPPNFSPDPPKHLNLMLLI